MASPAVRAAGGVNVGQLPSAQRAIRSPTAVPAARGPEAATASAASQDTGITVRPAAGVSQETKCSFSVCKLEDRELEELVEECHVHSCQNRMNSAFHSQNCSSTGVREPDDITMQLKRVYIVQLLKPLIPQQGDHKADVQTSCQTTLCSS